MAKRASVVFAVKWFVVPIVLAAVGFFVLGPLVEGRAAVQDAKESAKVLEEPRRFTSEPDVDVSVAPAPRRTPSRTRSTPVRRTTVQEPPPTAPDDSPPPLVDPPGDQAEPPPAGAGGTVVEPGSTPPPPPTSGTVDTPPGTVPPPR